MTVVSIIVDVVGIVGLVYGYRKNNRNILLVSALVLWLGGSIGDFERGFLSGLQGR